MTRLNKAAGKILFDDVNEMIEAYSDIGYGQKSFAGLPVEIFDTARLVAVSFNMRLFTPNLSEEEAFSEPHMRMFCALFILMGFKIYEKERELRVGTLDWKYNLDRKEQLGIFQELVSNLGDWEKIVLSQPADYAIELSLKQGKKNLKMDAFNMKGRKLEKRKFWNFAPSLFLLGYNFAHEIIFPQIPVEPDWPKRVMKGV